MCCSLFWWHRAHWLGNVLNSTKTLHLPLTTRSPASPLPSHIKVPQPRSKEVCCSGPSYFLPSALCLLIRSRKAWLLNTFSGPVFPSLSAGRPCFSSWHLVAQGSVWRHEVSLLERPLQDVRPRNTEMLCNYLFADCDFISIIRLHQILSFGIMPCLCFTSGTGACLLHPRILLNIFRIWASQFPTE